MCILLPRSYLTINLLWFGVLPQKINCHKDNSKSGLKILAGDFLLLSTLKLPSKQQVVPKSPLQVLSSLKYCYSVLMKYNRRSLKY